MTRLLLVRHGQSTWNAESRWQGQADPPLSDLGERQAAAAAEHIASAIAIDVVWSSDLVRAQRTAEVIAGRLTVVMRVDPRLRERNAGAWTGLTRADIEERYPGDLQARRSPPGFEQDGPLFDRVEAALREVAGTDTAEVLVVTHGGVVRTVERHFGAPPDPVPNLGGRWLEVSAGGMTLGDRELLIDPDEVAVTVPRSI